MGEQKFFMKPVVQACEEALLTAGGSGDGQDMRVSTPGGVFHVRWDSRGGATAMGQLPLFAEYLDATGLFEDWIKGCPLSYVSPLSTKAPQLAKFERWVAMMRFIVDRILVAAQPEFWLTPVAHTSG